MAGILAKRWVSQDILNKADDLGIEIWVRKMDCAVYPLDDQDITYVACTRHPRAINDAQYSQETSYELKDLDILVKEHAKEAGLDFKDMLYFPVFISLAGNIDYSTTQSDNKYFGGYVYFSKKFIRSRLSVTTIRSATKKVAQALAETALIKLSQWTYGDVYSVSIERDDEMISETTDIYTLAMINEIADNLMNKLLMKIAI